jgi:transcriptional regulator with XRE-family HTH domain
VIRIETVSMSISPEPAAKTLTQLVATEIRVQMARADVRQSQLARELGKTEQWLSVRLRGKQPIDLNDLALIARALGVSVHQLLPPADIAANAAHPDESTGASRGRTLVIDPNSLDAESTTRKRKAPLDNRPSGRSAGVAPPAVRRTALVERPRRPKRS